ncbi:free fatty acid receptor 3-like [Pempheris klunzingeri]|uniref:free fatty acid receptor 3-like n=1 Tax=Pempheris klunzingeri TaxID=3127111 RepID=UPI003980AED1
MVASLQSEVILSVYIITFLIGLPANLLALCAFSLKIHAKPLPTDILLLNLTISDLMFLLILPLKMCEVAADMKWNLPDVLCSISSFIFFSTIYTSALLLMAVSVVRYVAVAFPVAYVRLQKPVIAIVVSAAAWLFSGAHCSVIFIMEHHPSLSSGNPGVCYKNFSQEQLEILLPVRFEIFFMLCLAPLLVCTFCYSSCIWILYSRPSISRMRRQRAIGMAAGTLAVFLVCVMPYNSSHLLGYFQGESPEWRYYALLLSAFNTILDPVIFYFSSSAFRYSSDKFIFRRRQDSGSQRPAATSCRESSTRLGQLEHTQR